MPGKESKTTVSAANKATRAVLRLVFNQVTLPYNGFRVVALYMEYASSSAFFNEAFPVLP